MKNSFSHNLMPDSVSNQTYIARPRVHALLERAAQSPIVTLIAGAGYGKTQAVYAFLRQYKAGMLWIQLSEGDNLGWRFWEKFVRALAKDDNSLFSRLLQIGVPETERQFANCLTIITDWMTPGLKYIIVFDDFHVIHDKAVLRFMELFIGTPFPNLTTIIISRNEVEINIIGLIAKGLVFRVSEDELRFDKEEMLEYFRLLGVTPSPQAASDMYDATAGWVFAINLLGLSLKSNGLRVDRALAAMRHNIFNLMETEIFSACSRGLQVFLVKLSLIDDLSPKLLEELTSDSQLIVDMEKISSFIRYDAYTGTYRIHRLFLDYLHQKQNMLEQSEKFAVYGKAARWCAENGYTVDATAYCEKARDYRGLAEIAHKLTRMMSAHVALFLLDILDKLPEWAYSENLQLYIIKNKALQTLARFDEASAQALQTIAYYEAAPPAPDIYWLLSECYFNLGYIGVFTAIYTNERDYSHYFSMGHRYFILSGRMVKGPRERTLVSSYVCRVAYPAAKGSFELSTKVFASYAHYVSEAKDGMMYGIVDLAYSEIAYFKGELKDAEKLALQTVTKAREKEQFQIENRALFFLIRIAIHMGAPEKIRGLFRELESQLENEAFLKGHTIYDIVTGWFFTQTRQASRVPSWLKSAFEKSDLNSLLYGLENIVRAKYFMAIDQYHAAMASLDGQDGMYGLEAFLLGKLEVSVLRAVCLYHIGDKAGALDTLRTAYEISLEDGLDMPFIETGKDMRTLASAAMKEGASAIPRPWLEKIRRKSSTYAKKLAYVISDFKGRGSPEGEGFSLTARERELLTDLCHGLSQAEIALNHDMSVNTVKASVQMIYAKIGAENNADAIRIASATHLIE
ncbi:MAG: LuxR C-terminal-related transcriptional regulator [Clostridiales bacterium]|nr:LuxR C-terminal-related transcriptional regulator [Clostridiales bacterium]